MGFFLSEKLHFFSVRKLLGVDPPIPSSIYSPLIFITLGPNFSKLHFPFLQNGD